MAKSNRNRVETILMVLKEGLGPFVLREYKMVYRKDYLRELEATVSRDHRYDVDTFATEENVLGKLDAQAWLKAIMFQWHEVFKTKLGHSERSYVSELMDQRNKWGHQEAFTLDDAYRTADTATRLLKAINAARQAVSVEQIANELMRLRFEREQERAKKEKPRMEEAPTVTKPGLKPWRYVVKPHPDVYEGRYIQAQFAADLGQVIKGEASAEYGDPQEFFRRTYLTEGLVELLATGIKRLTGQGGDPVVQLQTSFGGGKTHSMLAMYHLVGGNINISQIPDGELIMQHVGEVDDRVEANIAVLVGTSFSATEPRVYDDVTTHTLWGEMAYQLGGVEAYQMVENADVTGVAPGSDTLKALLEAYGPALIIIDELVAFARNLYNVPDRLPAGSFEAVMTFTQSLTEAVRRASDAMLLISIPESDIEIGGEGGKEALNILAKTIGRIEAVWKPVTATESFEIVRRRLFSSEMDYAARDAVLSDFREMYANSKSDYPAGASDGEYFDRLRAAYPIHPELFDRLYQDWSTLDRFQKTRGVLRLMAAVIYELWLHGDQSLMIMPASIPLDAPNVRNEILRYLPENWPAVVDVDIDGAESRPVQNDKQVPTLGQYNASRRVARTIFMGSAPTVAEQAVRGVEEVRINLATVQPGEPSAVFGDALRRLSNQLTYLYSDGTRYWYDTRPTVNRVAADRAQNIHPDTVLEEAIQRLRKVRKAHFSGYHVAPQSGGDVADEPVARLVILPPDAPHKNKDMTSDAVQMAQEILESRGNSPRLYRNMLMFVAPDLQLSEAFAEAIQKFLAWESIYDERESLNLDAQQLKQVRTNRERMDETVDARLLETYNWLLVPHQPDPTGPIQWQAYRMSGSDSFYDRAERKLRQNELLIRKWAGYNLSMVLDKYLWRDESHLSIKQLWEYLARYCYLPRLNDEQVLINAIADGVSLSDAPFAYAEVVTEDAYRGLRFREPSRVLLTDQSVIVHPEIAEAQLESMRREQEERAANQSTPTATASQRPAQRNRTIVPDDTPAEPEEVLMRRFYGSVSLNPERVKQEIDTIAEEIIERLTKLSGTEVSVTLEIHAQREEGFDEASMRTVNENSRTLKFDSHGFEER